MRALQVRDDLEKTPPLIVNRVTTPVQEGGTLSKSHNQSNIQEGEFFHHKNDKSRHILKFPCQRSESHNFEQMILGVPYRDDTE